MEKFCTASDEFDDIRPYNDAEVALAMRRIAQSQWLPQLANFVFPELSAQDVARMLMQITTTKQFQHRVMYHFNRQVMRRSVASFACEGLEQLRPGRPYLFVSNHRDIVLDASLLQNALVDAGHETCQITFGANLMTHPTVVDIGKSNKMFRVERGGTKRQFYESELHLSRYIRYAIVEQGESVWIAQRNGRTKDGLDRTEPALVKMFALSGQGDKLASLAQLNIVPVAVSYEYEPCDLLKAREIAQTAHQPYVKSPGEDLNSILTGILQPKGKVHFHVCQPIGEQQIAALAHLPLNDAVREVALAIDRAIAQAYRLMPTNLAAYAMLHPETPLAAPLHEAETWLRQRMALLANDAERRHFLHIYANPAVAARPFKQNPT